MLRRVIDALLCAHSTFRIDAVATVKLTDIYKLVYPAIYCCAARHKAANFQRVKNAVIRPRAKRRYELSSDAWDEPRRRSTSCGSRPAIAWQKLPVEPAIRIGSGTRRSAPRRRAARSRHTLPNRRDGATAARHDGKGWQVPKHSVLTRQQQHTSKGQHGPAPPE